MAWECLRLTARLELKEGGRALSTTIREAYRRYSAAPAATRTIFGGSTGFAVTLAGARLVNLVRERDRPAPAVRGALRQVRHPFGDDIRVHHYLPGIGLVGATGGTAIVLGDNGHDRWLSPLFGAGVALVTDELELLVGRSNGYWRSHGMAAVQFGMAAAVAAASWILIAAQRPEPQPREVEVGVPTSG